MTVTDERTPLISHGGSQGSSANAGQVEHDASKTPSTSSSWLRRMLKSSENRVLACAALITIAFDINQVTQLYAFYLMECDIYYDKHGPWDGKGERCRHDEISAGGSLQFSILAMLTNLFGVVNLFVVGWMIRKWGPRATLVVQVMVPGLRVCIQSVGIIVGRRTGEVIIQLSQVVTIIGGPSGYRLALNTIAGEVVPPERRTAIFGELQGTILVFQGICRLLGGYIGDRVGILAPYIISAVTYMIAAPVAGCYLPYISAESMFGDQKKEPGGISTFFAPLKVLIPQQVRLASGRKSRHYGVTLLCAGIFIGVFATGTSATLLQLYAASSFGFDQTGLAFLMFEFCMMRGFFLVGVFPRIIAWGREWFLSMSKSKVAKHSSDSDVVAPHEDESRDALLPPPKATGIKSDFETYHFDLFFLRWSYLADGMFMFLGAIMTQSWHVHLAAWVLPIASGSAAAAKGSITAMTPASKRADALSAMNLVELAARLMTQGLFGLIFSSFAAIGKASLTFYCNGALALVALCVLLLSHFPPHGSTILEDYQGDEDDDDECATQCEGR